MGPVSRFLGPWVPEHQLWQDPVLTVDHELIGDKKIAALKDSILASGLSVQRLVSTAWAAAASFRGTDLRGGANGGRIRLAPQKDWEVNDPEALAPVLRTLEQLHEEFNGSLSDGKKLSFADVVVLAGSAAIEKAAKDAGYELTVPFARGRTDATEDETDVESFGWLQTNADGFRNYLAAGEKQPPERLLLEKAYRLTLTAPEMTVLVGGLRALGANHGGSKHGVLTDKPGTLTNDFFKNLLDMIRSGTFRSRRRTSTKDVIDAPASSSGPRPASIWSSGRTPSCARWPRCTPLPTPTRNSRPTSSPRGSR